MFNVVSHKSGYIKPIREAFDFVERYFKEMFLDSDKNFSSTCVESLTGAKLLEELGSSSVKIIKNEVLKYIKYHVFCRNLFPQMKIVR